MNSQTVSETREPLLNNLLKLFMFAMVLANIAGEMYGSILPLYLKDLNASVVQIGLFFTLSRILPLVLQILGGWISDSLGRLRSIAWGSIAGVFSYIGLILAPTWQWVLLGEGLGAITRSLVAPSFGAFIAEQSSEKNRARVFGITDTIFMLVVVIGPPLGGWLAGQYGFKIMLITAGCLYTLATILRVGMARVASRTHEANPEKLSAQSLKIKLSAMTGMVLAGGVLTWILITDGVRDVAFSMSFTLMPIYLEETGGLSVSQIGWLSSIFGIFMMITSTPSGWLADKKGERVSIVSGFILVFIALILFINLSGFWSYAFIWAIFGVGVGMMSPAYNSLISKAVPEKLRGTAFGLLQSSLGLFSLPAPAIGAQLWTRIGPSFPFSLTAWVSLITIIPAWLKFKLPSKKDTIETETLIE
ncbi:MAG: MFS transporter [Anaerolineales bacterium]|nr:MFS transporter [Anaerolineales bacterium]